MHTPGFDESAETLDRVISEIRRHMLRTALPSENLAAVTQAIGICSIAKALLVIADKQAYYK